MKFNFYEFEKNCLTNYVLKITDYIDIQKQSRLIYKFIMRFIEKFDQHKLSFIINNKDRFAFRITDPSYDPIKAMKKYLDKSKNGQITVDYHQAHGRPFGRWFANDGCSLQSLPREVRHTIARDYYIDIDIVNAHPVLLVQICNNNNIDCDEIEDYVNDREKYIQELLDVNPEMTRDDAKTTFLSILNGGKKAYKSAKKKTRFLKRFKRQMEEILDEIKTKFPDEYKYREELKENRNVKGSTVNALLCEAENQCLMTIVEFLREKTVVDTEAVLCFDGVMIPSNESNIKFARDTLASVKEFVKTKTGYSISLKIKEMDEAYELPEAVPPHVEVRAFDPTDSFTWLDFVNKYHGQTFTSEQHLLQSTIKDLNRVYAWVEGASTNHVRKTDTSNNLFDIIDGRGKISKLFFKLQSGEKVKKITFDQYVSEFLLNIKTYQSIDFDPSCSNPRMFNLWTGYQASQVEYKNEEQHAEKPPAELNLILKHLFEVYCSSNEETYEYFLDLLYMMLKYPEKPLRVAVFLFSRKQGTGKNTFLDFMRDFVVGKQMTYECAGLDCVVSKHNSMMKNKKLVVVDEIASSSDAWCSNFERMKTLITSESIEINPKGVNQFLVKNLATYFFLSNNPDAIRLEASDRRYLCLEVSDKYLNNHDYFSRLRNTFNQTTGDLFYSWIIQRGDSKVVDVRKIPATQFKRDIIRQSASSSTLFLEYLTVNKDELKDEEFNGVDEDYRVNASRFYEIYTRWCSANGERAKKQRKFFLDIKDNITKTHTRAGNKYDISSVNSSI